MTTKETATEEQSSSSMNFGQAIQALKNGNTVYRKGWNGKGQSLSLQLPDKNSKITVPYIYITTVQGDLVPWVPSIGDTLAEDWYLLVKEQS